jgi:hypothetical protein
MCNPDIDAGGFVPANLADLCLNVAVSKANNTDRCLNGLDMEEYFG